MCHWCGESPKVLAGDGTKIGIFMQKISIVPIESASKDEVIQTPHRKFDRCFLAYPSNLGSTLTEKNIRDGRKHMKLIMSSTNGFLEQPILSNEQLANRNRQLICIFPDKCKTLLDRLFKLNVSADQSKACSNLFYLLSFDAPLRTVFPEKIMGDFRKMLQRIDNGEMDPCKDFISICEKVNPHLGNFVRVFDYGDAFDNDALVFLKTSMNKFG